MKVYGTGIYENDRADLVGWRICTSQYLKSKMLLNG